MAVNTDSLPLAAADARAEFLNVVLAEDAIRQGLSSNVGDGVDVGKPAQFASQQVPLNIDAEKFAGFTPGA